MRLASASKAFSGAAALALVAKGKLSLNDTIGQLLPGLPSAWAQVTLAELLNQTSGLPDYTASKALAARLRSSPAVAASPSDLLADVKDEPLAFTPGSRYAYSNSDNIVVAMMLESVTGLPYAAVLDQEVERRSGLLGRACLPRPPCPSHSSTATWLSPRARWRT